MVSSIRISDFFEILDLTKHPRYDSSKLLELCLKLGADFAVNYVFLIVSEMFACNLSLLPEKSLPFVKLMNASFSPYLIKDYTYYAETPYLSFEELVDNMNCGTCKTGEHYFTEDLINVYYASTGSITNDFSFIITENRNEMYFDFFIDDIINQGDNFFVITSTNFAHIWLDDYPDKVRVYGKNALYVVKLQNVNYKFRVILTDIRNGDFYTVLAFGKQTAIDKNVTVVPLKIDRSSL